MDEDDVIMHMDLKDFFMTGTDEFLTHHASLLVPLRFREVFRSFLDVFAEQSAGNIVCLSE